MFEKVTEAKIHDDSSLTLKEIEQLEYKYLQKYWYFLKYAEDDIIRGFNSKNEIKKDWEGHYGTEAGGISDFDVGSERIVYALLNGKIAGQPNSCPVSSDLFFEVDDAYIHIDLKSVTTTDGISIDSKTGKKLTDNIGDFNTSIFIGQNQNSYKGNMIVNKGRESEETRKYVPNLPTIYTKRNGEKKINLTYFVTILSNSITTKTELISIMNVPNGKLEEYYKERPLKAGKTPDKTRFNFKECQSFELLENNPKRVRIVYINPEMTETMKSKLDLYLKNFLPKVIE